MDDKDEALKWRLLELSVSIVNASDFSLFVERYKQAFREAGWHPESECLKGIDLGEMLYYTGLIGILHPQIAREKQRQVCIDWLKKVSFTFS